MDMADQEATLQQVREYFGLTARELMEGWRALDDATKTWFKVEIAKQLLAELEGV